MIDHLQIARRFGRAALHYDQHATSQQRILQQSVARARKPLDQSRIIADIGGGTGQLQTLLPNKTIIMCDASLPMCQQAKTSLAITSDMHQLPLADQSVSCYFSSLAWQWSYDITQAAKEACRVVEDGGYVMISSLTDGTLQALSDAWAAIGQHGRMLDFKPLNNYEEALADAGFILEESYHEPIMLHYDSVRALLHSMKAIGASFSQSDKPLTRGLLQKLEAAYAQTDDKIAATWQWSYFLARKAAV